MNKIYLIVDATGNVTGWTLTREFANRVVAANETILEMTA